MKVLAFPKPEPRKRAKARAKRQEGALAEKVRAACVERDGYCRLHWVRDHLTCALDVCVGPSEWAHLGDKRRFKTRGMTAAERHSTEWTAMLCQGHHVAYDAHDFDLEPMTDRGADGRLRLRIGRRAYEEVG